MGKYTALTTILFIWRNVCNRNPVYRYTDTNRAPLIYPNKSKKHSFQVPDSGGLAVWRRRVCGRSFAGIAGSNSSDVMDVCLWWVLFVVS